MEEETVPTWAVSLARDMRGLEQEVKRLGVVVDENNRTLRGNNGNKGLCSRMEAIEIVLNNLQAGVQDLKQNLRDTEGEISEKSDFRYLSWQWVIDKLGVPVVIAMITFGAFTLCPVVIVIAALMPQILAMLKIGP